MRRAFGAGSRVKRERVARKKVFAWMQRATSRAHLRNSKCFDEIRISCAREICARRAKAREIFRLAQIFRARLRSNGACVHSKIILHNLRCATAPTDGIDQKRANQRQVIRGEYHRAALSFSLTRAFNCDCDRKFSSTMRNRRHHVRKNDAHARVRRRVSFSRDR